MKGDIEEIRTVAEGDLCNFTNKVKSIKSLFQRDLNLVVEIQFSTTSVYSGELMYSALIIGRRK